MPWTTARKCLMLASIIINATALSAPDLLFTKILLGLSTGLSGASIYLLQQEETSRKNNVDKEVQRRVDNQDQYTEDQEGN